MLLLLTALTLNIGAFPGPVNASKDLGKTKRAILIGAHIGTTPTPETLKKFEALQGQKLDVVNLFVPWESKISDYSDAIEAIYKNGSIMMLTWEPLGYTTVDIANGKYDHLIIRAAKELKSLGKVFWIGTMHEVNGNWYPWCIGDSKINTKDTYIKAFRHCVNLFRKEGVTNGKWIYNISNDNVGANTGYMIQYPGNEFVDIVSINGYNWGTSTDKFITRWVSFDEVFAPSYNAVKVTGKPVVLGEWSSTEVGGNKATWIGDAFKRLNSPDYKQIKAVLWFHEKKETDWRINSSPAVLTAYKNGLSQLKNK